MLNSSFLQYLLSELIIETINKKYPIESHLHSLGVKITPALIELYKFDRDVELSSLLYKITHLFLPHIFTTNRRLKMENEKKYFIIENKPLFMSAMSIPTKGFSSDAVIAGIIERILLGMGFICVVTAYTMPEDGLLRKTVYCIELK